MKKITNRTKKLVVTAIAAALTLAVTALIQFPAPVAQGYINVGDAIIFISAVLFGPIVGLLAGGLGSMLADVITGYVHWALPTLIIKGAEGFIVGLFAAFFKKLNVNRIVGAILSMFTGAVVCLAGYFFAAAAMYSSFAVAGFDLISNLIQISISLGIAITVLSVLPKKVYSEFDEINKK